MEIIQLDSAHLFIDSSDVLAGVSTCRGGISTGSYSSLNLGLNTDDDFLTVSENRRAFFESILPGVPVCYVRQTHSAIVVDADSADFSNGSEGDALFSFERGKLLSITVADCGNILLYQPDVCCAAIHAGWRGARTGIIRSTVEQLVNNGADARMLRANIGPMIRADNYQVGAEFTEYFPTTYLLPDGERFQLDLPRYIADELSAAGVTDITDCGEDTFSSVGKYYSYRRSSITGRMSAFIALR